MRNEGGGGIVDEIAVLAVDEEIVLTSFRQRATPVALLGRLGGVGTIAVAARAGRPT
jgi:hypothetical protein